MRALIEFVYTLRVLLAARCIQRFLWDESRPHTVDTFRGIFHKRVAKLDDIDPTKPHWEVELRKRLLQNAVVCIKMLAMLDQKRVTR